MTREQITELFPISMILFQADINRSMRDTLDENIFSRILREWLAIKNIKAEVSWGTVRGIVFVDDMLFRLTTQENVNVMTLDKQRLVTFIITE